MDVIQIPVYPESFMIYIILSAMIFGFVSLVLFMYVFSRRDYKQVLLKTSSTQGDMKNVYSYTKEYHKRLNDYVKGLEKGITGNLESMKNFVIELNEEESKKITSTRRKVKELDNEVSVIKKDMKNIQTGISKEVNKKFRDLAMFYLIQIFEELLSEENENIISKKLENLRFFINFNKKNKYWNKALEKKTTDFLKSMGERWKPKSKSISMMYSILVEDIKRKK